MFESSYLTRHMSEFLRLISLYKFGGIYLDLDFIVLQPISNGTQNFAGFYESILINNDALSFAKEGIGHLILEKLIW